MKNAHFIFAILLMSGLFSNVFAQEKKWEIGGAMTHSSLRLTQKSNDLSGGGKSSNGMAVMNAYVTRAVTKNIDFGVGIGFANLIYDFKVYKTVNQLHNTIQYSQQPDFSKKSQTLKEITYSNNYLNVPVFAKFNLSKNPEKSFQPSFGLRLDNYFLKNSSATYDFTKNGNNSVTGDLLGSLVLSIITGELILIDSENQDIYAPLTTTQRREIADFYDNQNANFMMNISPSVNLEWRFNKVTFGFEPFLIFGAKKVHQQLEKQSGLGVRTQFAIRF